MPGTGQGTGVKSGVLWLSFLSHLQNQGQQRAALSLPVGLRGAMNTVCGLCSILRPRTICTPPMSRMPKKLEFLTCFNLITLKIFRDRFMFISK